MIRIPFKNFITLQRGFDLPAGDRIDGPYPVVASSTINGFHNEYKVQPPGVTTGRSGSLGKVLFLDTPFWPLNTALWVKDFKGNVPRYVFYLLQTLGLETYNSGAGVPTLNRNHLDELEIQVPDPSTQGRIASVLSDYDDLIENNTRRIQILEEMAQTIYREWFVNFRFPGHEHARMIESELGAIPEGWRLGRLEDAVVLQRGFDLPTSQRIPGEVPIIAATGINGTHNVAKVTAPGVVTGRSGSLGTVMLVWEDFWPLNTALWAKEFRQSNPLHAYFTLQTIDLKGFNSGAAVPTLNRNDIHGLPTVLPDRGTLGSFNECLMPLFTLKRNLEAKNSNLRTTRDFLLPKLISGEIPLETAVEVAAEFMEQTA